ncbi:MAG: 4-hydroxybenzoate octaprenyltransferase [Betaproteobacteria bacterium]|nr:4-hydroxybenzoate octaprenyltransferase [Betaproteobacteria bacterium]
MTLQQLKERLIAYEELMRLNMVGGLLLLWPQMWALWLASKGSPDPVWIAIFAIGAILMHSAGCIANDYADRKFDIRVARTKSRPLVSGTVSVPEAFILMALCCLVCFLLILPRLTPLFMAFTAIALVVAFSYPFAKRFFPLPQVWLGFAFGLGIPMAWVAETGQTSMETWILVVANIFWVLAYDTEYAMTDRPDDLKIGIHTSAITFGRHDVLAVMCSYGISFALIAWVGLDAGLGAVFLASLIIAFLFAGHHYTLIRNRESEGCMKAFSQNNWVGMTIFAGIALDYLLQGHMLF